MSSGECKKCRKKKSLEKMRFELYSPRRKNTGITIR